MKLELDCLPCIFQQTLEASRMVTNDEALIREIMNEYARLVLEIDDEKLTPVLVEKTQDIIKRKTGVDDLYKEYKERHIRRAQKLYPEIKEVVDSSDDPLFASLVVAAAGNSIDAGISRDVNVEEKVKVGIEQGFTRSSYYLFKEQLIPDITVLILGDNSGEAVFDQLLIDKLRKTGAKIVYAVREEPILNDITFQEAKEIGLDQQVEVVSSGSRAPGILLSEVTTKFRQIYEQADVVISKGQGNYEALSDVEQSIFFLLQAKCDLVARQLEVNTGEQVFKLLN